MANETIGELPHHCGHLADVRKNIKGKLYVMCPHCGQLPYNLPGGQNYILDNTVMYPATGKPEPVTASAVTDEVEVHEIAAARNVTEAEPVTAPEPVTAAGGYGDYY